MDKEELINGYFESTLTEAQKKEVDRLLASDAEFAADFEFQKELQLALKKEERQTIKKMFGALPETKKPIQSKLIKFRPYLAAASIALLVGLGSILFYFNNAGLNTEALYNNNFAPYDNVVYPLERGDQIEDLTAKAFTAYENQDYPLALSLFKALNSELEESYIDFYEAIVMMQLNMHQDAIPLLENYIATDGALTDRSIWYLALSYLKINEVEKCKTQLRLLIKKNGFKVVAAENLLDQLP